MLDFSNYYHTTTVPTHTSAYTGKRQLPVLVYNSTGQCQPAPVLGSNTSIAQAPQTPRHLEVWDSHACWHADPAGSIHRRKSSQSSLKSFMSNPEYYLRENSPTSEESSIDSWGSVNNNSGGYRRQHRKSSPSRLYGESGHKSASDISSMILQHQYNHQMLRIRRLNSYAGSFECRFCVRRSTMIFSVSKCQISNYLNCI